MATLMKKFVQQHDGVMESQIQLKTAEKRAEKFSHKSNLKRLSTRPTQITLKRRNVFQR